MAKFIKKSFLISIALFVCLALYFSYKTRHEVNKEIVVKLRQKVGGGDEQKFISPFFYLFNALFYVAETQYKHVIKQDSSGVFVPFPLSNINTLGPLRHRVSIQTTYIFN